MPEKPISNSLPSSASVDVPRDGLSEESPWYCTVCGGEFGSNPRVRKWFCGAVRPSEFPKVTLCWVCARLAASVALEAAEMRGMCDHDADQS
jgi:hypothetical protein